MIICENPRGEKTVRLLFNDLCSEYLAPSVKKLPVTLIASLILKGLKK